MVISRVSVEEAQQEWVQKRCNSLGAITVFICKLLASIMREMPVISSLPPKLTNNKQIMEYKRIG